MLKKMALESKAAMALEKTRFERGDSRMRRSGMMGLETRDSIHINAGKQTAKMMSEAMTNG